VSQPLSSVTVVSRCRQSLSSVAAVVALRGGTLATDKPISTGRQPEACCCALLRVGVGSFCSLVSGV
jgi:hypothetical protein